MGLRGLAIGLGKELIVVTPRAVRCALGTMTGDYQNNKREHVLYCSRLGFDFKEVEPMKRCHIADTVCNTIYYLSKTGRYILDDSGEPRTTYRAFSKGRAKLDAHSISLASQAVSARGRTSSSQSSDAPPK